MKIIPFPAALLLVMIFLASSASPTHHDKFNVHDFGAKGDGITDDSEVVYIYDVYITCTFNSINAN